MNFYIFSFYPHFQSHAICIFLFYLFHFSLFPFTEFSFLECKQYVGARIGTLVSISDGLGPSIFCRRMEKALPMREYMDGIIIPRRSRHFYFDVLKL